MGFAIELKDFRGSTFFHRWFHRLFKCPTFWQIKPRFTCPICGGGYRCYWDGNDVDGHGVDICNPCFKEIGETKV